jgi:diaminopimelate decarboxylase
LHQHHPQRIHKYFVQRLQCCESGDILTPQHGDAEALNPRLLRKVMVGDYLMIEGVGAYCSGMSLKKLQLFS